MVVQFIFFLNSANLTCRGTDISKYFLGLRDNESRLSPLEKKCYIWCSFGEIKFDLTLKKKTKKLSFVRFLEKQGKPSIEPILISALNIQLYYRRSKRHPYIITKTYLYNVDPLKSHFYIVKLGFTGVYIIFHISAQNIDCGYSLEPPRRGGSNEYHNLCFWADIRKILEFLSESFHILLQNFPIFLNRLVFVMLFLLSPNLALN